MYKFIFLCLLVIIYQEKSHANLIGLNQELTWKCKGGTLEVYSLMEAIYGIISITNSIRSSDQYSLANSNLKHVPKEVIDNFIAGISSLLYNDINLKIKRYAPDSKEPLTAHEVSVELDQWYRMLNKVDTDKLSPEENNALKLFLDPESTAICSDLLDKISGYTEDNPFTDEDIDTTSRISKHEACFLLNPPSRKKAYDTLINKIADSDATIAELEAIKETEKPETKRPYEDIDISFFTKSDPTTRKAKKPKKTLKIKITKNTNERFVLNPSNSP